VFAPISAISAFLFFASTLPNGVRVGELPASGDSIEIVAGYTSGGLTDLTSTAAAKALLLDSYAVGGKIQFISELDRTALRMTVPQWAAPALFDDLPAFFQQVPEGDNGSHPSSPDFREKVEEEIRSALLGSQAASSGYTTENAFLLISSAVPSKLREALAAIPTRASMKAANEVVERLPAERTLRFKSDLSTGGVVFAAPAPAVYYKQWYLILMSDRLIHRTVALPLKTSLPLTARPYYYRIELPLAAGQFPEPAEENLLQELQRLQFTPAKPADMTAARRDALAYLDSKDVREWFASHDISDRRLEGIQWLESVTTDELRTAVRDLLISNHVVATWAPKPKQTTVSVEALSASTAPPSSASGSVKAPEPAEGRIVVFPAHTDPSTTTRLPETLSSGVSLVPSNIEAVFISGGSLTRLDHVLAADDLKSFAKYPSMRLLVLAPPSSIDRMRQLWSTFKGNASGEMGVPQGKVTTGDLAALFILKTIVDMKLIEAGWFRDVELRIDASEGSNLVIEGDSFKRAQVMEWIKSLATTLPPEKYFNWAREVAIHHFGSVRADLQALTWERDRQGEIPEFATITPQQVQDVARIYFQ
jgi:hypothetical protein